MVHLEVTGKENRALCIKNGDKDKHSGALRNLSKGLFKRLKTEHVFCLFEPLCCDNGQPCIYSIVLLHPY